MEAGGRILQNFLQPAGDFVQRPPLVWRRVRLICGVSVAFWIAAAVTIALVAYNQSFLDVKEPWAGGPEAARREDCQETTVYPLTVNVPLNSMSSLDVTLNGPKYLDKGRVRKLIENMTCAVPLPESGTIQVAIEDPVVRSNPEDFRRACQHPEDDSVLIKAKPDYHTTSLYRFVTTIKALQALQRDKLRPPPNVSDFIIYRVIMETTVSGVDGVDGLASIVSFRLLFDDGIVLFLVVGLYCEKDSPVLANVYRDCTFGAPYEYGPQGEAVYTFTNPRLCPMGSAAAHAEGVMRQLLEHRSMEGYLGNWHDGARANDMMPSMRNLLLQVCSRAATPGQSWFYEQETKEALRSPRSFENIIESVAGNISTDGHYSFLCSQKAWQSYSVWLAIAYPMFAALMKVLSIVVPALYKFSNRLFMSRGRDDAPTPGGGGRGGGGGGVRVDAEVGAPQGVAPMELQEHRRLITALSLRCDGLEAALEARQPHRGSSRGDINGGGAAGTKDTPAEQSRLERDVKNVMGTIIDAAVSRQIEQLCQELLLPTTALAAGASAAAAAAIPRLAASASPLSAAGAALKQALAAASKEQAAALAAADEDFRRRITELDQIYMKTATALAAATAATAPLAGEPLAAGAGAEKVTEAAAVGRLRDEGKGGGGPPGGGRDWDRRAARCEASIRELRDKISEINFVMSFESRFDGALQASL